MTFPNTESRLCGVIHLGPTPGAGRVAGDSCRHSMGEMLALAVADARAYVEGGVDTLIVENFGDAPFAKSGVASETIAALTLAVAETQRVSGVREVGVNVLRNDARAALGICAATGATFIRVNVHTGGMYTDQGWIEGEAHATLRERARIASDVRIFADVHVKHATPVAGESLGDATRDAVLRGRADAVIVSGVATGVVPDVARMQRVKDASAGRVPLVVGSGFSASNAAELLRIADGAIVGTAAKRGGDVAQPVDAPRVAELVSASRLGR